MSSNGSRAAGQRSRAHQRVSRTSMQAAKQSEDDASSQPPKLEESSQAKTFKRGILVSWDGEVPRLPLGQRVLGVLSLALSLVFALWLLQELLLSLERQGSWYRCLGRGLVLVVAVPVNMIPLWWKEMLLLVMLLPPLESVVNFCRARMHGHGGRLVKWGAHEWVLDSGAWIHHTSELELLLEGGDFQFQEMDNKDAPSSGDDAAAALHAQGRGRVRTLYFDFPGVHYVVGDDTRNVVSVSQLARDHGLVTVFEPTSCHVKDKKTGQIIGKGRLRNGMYMLDCLRIVGQYIGDGGASGGDRHDGADGGGGGRGHEARGNGEGDSTAEGRGGGGRDGWGGAGGTGARDQEGSGSGAAGGDVNEINEEGGDEKETEEMNENDEDDIKEIGEINGKGEKEDDEKRGGQNSGQLSSRPYTGLFRLSPFACILWIVCILCIAACISLPYTIWGAGVAILGFQLLKTCTMQSTICKLKQIVGSLVFRGTSGDRESTEEEKTWRAYLLELSQHNKRLFGLSRFDETTDPSGYRRRQLPARAFPTSANAARQEDFFVDSGASFHTTWKESILFPYPRHLQNHTKPPTLSLGGIAAGSIAVTRSGYLNGNKIMLDGVLLALEAQANLVSVGQLSIQYGVHVEMDEVGVVIKKKQDGVQIGGGRMLNNLYVLEYFLPGGLFAHSPRLHP